MRPNLALRISIDRANLVKIAALCCLLLFGYVSQAHANSVTVGYSTTGVGPLSFQGDTFSLSGQSGSLTLDTASTTTQDINSATFFTGSSGLFSGSEPLTLTYDLTLDGVTEALTQAATWTITPSQDSFITVAASSPVLFVTSQGNWDVTLDAYSFTSTTVGLSQTASTPADFTPVPEPSTMALLGTGLLGLWMMVLRKRNSLGHPHAT